MDMTEFDYNGSTYRIGKLDAFKQFHVARRLAPVLASLGLGVERLKEMGGSFEELLGPISEVVSKMPEVDVDYILHACLHVTQRKQGDKWARVWAQGGGLLFQDMDMQAMLRITVEVVKGNLGGFFAMLPGAPSSTGSSAAEAPDQQA